MRSFLFLLWFVLVACGYSETQTPDATILGRLENRHYRNEHFGLDLTIPDSWELVTEGVGKSVAESAAKRSPELEAEAKQVRPKLAYIFKATRKSEAKPGEPWLQMTIVVHRGGARRGQETSDVYARKYLRDIARRADELKIIDPITEVRLNGKSFSRVRYFTRIKDMAINQSIYFRAVGDDILGLAAYYGLPEHLPILESVIRETSAKENK